MTHEVYLTLKTALKVMVDEIHSTDRYYNDNPNEAVFDLNADYRKKQLEKAFEAAQWLLEQKKNGFED